MALSLSFRFPFLPFRLCFVHLSRCPLFWRFSSPFVARDRRRPLFRMILKQEQWRGETMNFTSDNEVNQRNAFVHFFRISHFSLVRWFGLRVASTESPSRSALSFDRCLLRRRRPFRSIVFTLVLILIFMCVAPAKLGGCVCVCLCEARVSIPRIDDGVKRGRSDSTDAQPNENDKCLTLPV